MTDSSLEFGKVKNSFGEGSIGEIKEVKLKGIDGNLANNIFTLISAGIVLYTLYIGLFGTPSVVFHRPVHLGVVLFLTPLVYPSQIKWLSSNSLLERAVNIFLSVAGIITALYAMVNWERFFRYQLTNLDLIMMVILALVVLECTRRSIGMPIVIIALVSIAYAMFGNFMPGALAHRGYSFYRIVNMLTVGTEGVFGMPLGASSTYIAAFLVLAAFLQATGALRYFMKLAFSIAGQYAGGAAKVAVVSSGLTGTVSGSTVANVTATGSITIPLMKQTGFSPPFAGAVEAVASAGGAIAPPVMGATAFLIAEFLGVSYWDVVVAGTIPALLYYISLFNAVHLRSVRLGLLGIPRAELPSFLPALKETAHLLIPIAVLVMLLSMKFSALYAAFWTVMALLIAANLKPGSRTSLTNLRKAVRLAGRTILPISTACATAGIIIAMLNMTGIGQKMGYVITTVSGGSLIVALVLTQLAALILGTGLVTAATYTVLAVLVAPALVKMGAAPLAAHLFLFHFAIIGTLTPPVSLAAYAAAGIADSSPIKTGFLAFRLALPGFLIPYFFVLNPNLIAIGQPLNIFIASVTAAIGVIFMGIGLEGYLWKGLKPWERLAAIAGGVLLVYPQLATSILGLLICIGFLALVRTRLRFNRQEAV